MKVLPRFKWVRLFGKSDMGIDCLTASPNVKWVRRGGQVSGVNKWLKVNFCQNVKWVRLSGKTPGVIT